MTSQLHKDAEDQLDNRMEPLEMAQAIDNQSRMRLLPDDPSTDPEGAERRQQTTDNYPPFVFNLYKLSPVTLWNKRWPDGKEHLIPRSDTIEGCIQMAIAGEKTIGKMIDLAWAKSNAHNMTLIHSNWTDMIGQVDEPYVFGLMRQLGNLAASALAERAVQKYLYMDSVSRLNLAEGEDQPEWLNRARDRMIQAATIAGVYTWTHQECWTIAQYNGKPKYYLEFEIKTRLANNASYLEKNYGKNAKPQVTIDDQIALALAC
jgi:hypothetical protein